MSWVQSISINGLECIVWSDCSIYSGPISPVIGFNILSDGIREAILSRDDRIFDVLAWVYSEDFEYFYEAQWTKDSGWLEDYALKQESVLSFLTECLENPYIGTKVKAEIKSKLDEIEEKVHAFTFTQKRRNEFQKIRDQRMVELIERDGFECTECGRDEDLSIDHIIPLSKSGSDELDNLQILCRSCNSKKGDRV